MLKALALATALFALAANAKDIPPLTGPVIDQTGTLSVEQRDQIALELQQMKQDVQIQVWITDNLGDESIESLSIKATDAWKLGDKKKDNGVLILIAMQERRMRIEVGQGLEGAIPDVVAGRIVDSILKPHFRAGDFYGGLSKSANFIYGLATGRSSPEQLPQQRREKSAPPGMVLLFIFLIFFLKIVFGRRSFFWGGGGFGGGGWGGGSWGGGSSGGSSWSGGGGGFSGGGSSGSW